MTNGEEYEIAKPLVALHPGGLLRVNCYTLVVHNRRVLKDWLGLCESIRENAIRCYEWLSAHPDRPIPRRCYQLKHKGYQGVYCFEIGSGDRIYYRINESAREVLIYYAGSHPPRAPYPPNE